MLGTAKPKMLTPLPGPKSQELLALRNANVPKGVSASSPAIIARGEGAMVEDVDGNILVDWAGGIGVLNVGYCHPEVVEAVKKQSEKFLHSSINVLQYEPYFRLAEKMNQIIDVGEPAKTFFVNTGAEAVENAIKVAKRFTGRTDILVFEGAFHGRTNLAMAFTSKPKPYKIGFGPFPAGIHRMPYAYCYRCPHGLEYPACNMRCAKRLEEAMHFVVDPSELAAILVEPIQGEGFVPPPDEFLQTIRAICDKYKIVMIVDEVKNGFCRSGKMFAHEYTGIKPDIVTTAKSLGAGMPIAGVTAKASIVDATHSGGLGGTYSGNPVACAGALKVIEIMQRDNLAQKATDIGKVIIARFKKMQEKYPIIGDVRGRGAMIGMELVKDRVTKEPAPAETEAIIKDAYQNGLIIIDGGIYNNVIWVLVPLVITGEQVEAALNILDGVIGKVTLQV